MPIQSEASCSAKGEGRKLRRARNAVKRYSSKTDGKSVERFKRANALLVAAALRKDC